VGTLGLGATGARGRTLACRAQEWRRRRRQSRRWQRSRQRSRRQAAAQAAHRRKLGGEQSIRRDDDLKAGLCENREKGVLYLGRVYTTLLDRSRATHLLALVNDKFTICINGHRTSVASLRPVTRVAPAARLSKGFAKPSRRRLSCLHRVARGRARFPTELEALGRRVLSTLPAPPTRDTASIGEIAAAAPALAGMSTSVRSSSAGSAPLSSAAARAAHPASPGDPGVE
jgi:hypothetical protein